MDIAPLQRQVKAAELPLEKLAAHSQVTEAEKVGEVSRQFEAILLRQILGNAQKTVFTSRFNPQSVATGVYQDMITNELADNLSRCGGLGLAGVLKQQLAREIKCGATASSAPAPASTEPAPPPPNLCLKPSRR